MSWYMLDREYIRSTSSQGQGEDCLAICCSATSALVRSKSKAIKDGSCLRDRETEYYLISQSGMMSRLSEWITEKQQIISDSCNRLEMNSAFAEDSPARTSALPEKGEDWKENVPAYGVKCGESLAKWDQDTSSWRTPQCLLFEDSTECLEMLPKWGMTADGELWELTTPEHLIGGIGSGYWGKRNRHIPTPTCSDINARNKKSCTTDDNFRGISLAWLVEKEPQRMWPTPLAHDALGANSPASLIRKDGKSRMDQLANAVAYFPDNVSSNHGKLNPDWEEWLMGWPVGWTSLERLDQAEIDCWKQALADGAWWSVDPADIGKIPRTTEKTFYRKERIISIGNGQVPTCIYVSNKLLGGC